MSKLIWSGTRKKEIMVFRLVVLQMRMRSPLFGLLICIFFSWSFLKVSTNVWNRKGSGENSIVGRLTWVFPGRICDKFSISMCWLIHCLNKWSYSTVWMFYLTIYCPGVETEEYNIYILNNSAMIQSAERAANEAFLLEQKSTDIFFPLCKIIRRLYS